MTALHTLPSLQPQVSPAEWQARVDLAACYRLVALHGWDDLIFTHISAKIPDTEHFLINPYGLMFHEITASSLVKVDLAGNKVMDTPTRSIPPATPSTARCMRFATTSPASCIPIPPLGSPCRRSVRVCCPSASSRCSFWPACRRTVMRGRTEPRGKGATASRPGRDRLHAVAQSRPDDLRRQHRRHLSDDVHLPARLRNPSHGTGRWQRTDRHSEQILAGAKAMAAGVTRTRSGMGGALAWPALLRKLDVQSPGYDA